MSVEVGPLGVDVLKVLILGLLGAAAALAAHAGAAVYQDGLRTSVPELWRGGRDRRALAAFSYTISIGFIVAYALPYSLATGIVIIHIVLLAIDTIGLRFRRRAMAVVVGFLYAAFATIGIDLFVSLVRSTRGYASGIDQLFAPLAYTFPLLAPVAIANHYGPRWGAVSALATVIIWRLAEIIAHGGGLLGPLTPGGGAIALVVMTAVAVLPALRASASPVVDSAMYEGGVRRLRSHWPLLVAPPILIAIAASQGWLAGEPAQLVLLGVGSPSAAAAVALFSMVGFVPMIAISGLLSGVWNQDGYPDWYLAAGYVLPNPILAGLAGLALIVVELGTLRAVGNLLNTRPRIHGLGSAVRDALDSVPTLTILAGGVVASVGLAGTLGAVVVVGSYTMNESKGRPVMPIAVPVFAFLAVTLAVRVSVAAGVM